MMISSRQALGATKKEKIMVIGAGIVGTLIAYELSKAGAQVSLIDKAFPGSAASGNSFSWINATYPKKPYAYNLLSQLGIDAYKSLETEMDLRIRWSGSYEWFTSKEDQIKLFKEIETLKKYPRYSAVDVIKAGEARISEPNIILNDSSDIVFSKADGAMDTAHTIDLMIKNIENHGGSVLYPCEFQGLNYSNGKLSSVKTSMGSLEASQAIFATGIDTDNLFSKNMMNTSKPGIIMRTQPTDQRLNKIIVGPGVHLHQQTDGRIIFGEQAGAPSSHIERLREQPNQFPSHAFAKEHIDRILNTAKIFMKNIDDLKIEKTSIGWRPLPKDGKPIIGRLEETPDVYIATMHSGVSLAAIVAKLISQEILDGSKNVLLKDFRPSRFN